MTRFEFKYILNPVQEQALRSAVSKFLSLDMSAKKRGGWYPVTSLYFDTPQLADYYDKSGGYLIRKKLRARIYTPFLTPETPEIWLEIKKKHDMSFHKTRCLITMDDWNNLLQHRYTAVLTKERPLADATVLHEFMWYLLQEGRRPTFFIRYIRCPYRDAHSELRITFDSRIEAQAHPDLTKPSFLKPVHKHTVMEVKYSKETLPAWFGSLVRLYDVRRDSFSKYGVSVEQLHAFNRLPR
ncbi:MAG: hypothetical protein G01um101470_447 [Parcubacteria group bacterium Gr01-1014_70]|nr:MAG: hypothetical protein G01um101470_447 [Parcubacteria group bacterium Gr01-1014_70]